MFKNSFFPKLVSVGSLVSVSSSSAIFALDKKEKTNIIATSQQQTTNGVTAQIQNNNATPFIFTLLYNPILPFVNRLRNFIPGLSTQIVEPILYFSLLIRPLAEISPELRQSVIALNQMFRDLKQGLRERGINIDTTLSEQLSETNIKHVVSKAKTNAIEMSRNFIQSVRNLDYVVTHNNTTSNDIIFFGCELSRETLKLVGFYNAMQQINEHVKSQYDDTMIKHLFELNVS